jgi:prepilin-type N-terminal cleavage/methylation domain-containing protein
MAYRRAFTLIELLVVIAIIAILIGIIAPSLVQARRNAERTTCATRLRDVGMAMRSYLDGSNDVYPYASFMPSIGPFPLQDTDPLYISKVLTRDAVDQLEIFQCPSDRPNGEREAPNQGKTYFDTEGSSYEYRWRLGGMTIKELLDRMAQFGMRVPENTVWIFRDFENFHGTGGRPGARRYLYNDGHVTDFEM